LKCYQCRSEEGCCLYRNKLVSLTEPPDAIQLSRADCYGETDDNNILDFNVAKTAVNNKCTDLKKDGCCQCYPPFSNGGMKPGPEPGFNADYSYYTEKNKDDCIYNNASLTRLCEFFPDRIVKADGSGCGLKSSITASRAIYPTPTPTVPASPTTQGTTPVTVDSLDNPIGTEDPVAVINKGVNTGLGLLGSIAMLMIVWGGLQWMLAAGNDSKIKKGRDTMLWAAVGLIIIFMAYVIVIAVIQAVGAVSP